MEAVTRVDGPSALPEAKLKALVMLSRRFADSSFHSWAAVKRLVELNTRGPLCATSDRAREQ
jgi:hypothetical protein